MKNKFLNRFQWPLVVTILIIYFSLALWSAITEGVTSDEVYHLPAGYSYLKTGDYRMNYEHPPLIKIIAAIPLLALDINQSIFMSEAWERGNDQEWEFGHLLMSSSNSSQDEILLAGRIPIIILGMLLGLLIFLFARDLFGVCAGLTSLAMYTFFPEALAHGHYVTTDLGVALGITASIYFWYKFSTATQRKTLWLACCGITTGFALLFLNISH